MKDPTSEEVTAATLKAKDAVMDAIRETVAGYFALYERLGRIPSLYLQSPDLARDEIVRIGDAECNLTGDCEASAALADLLDPEGEHFHKIHPDDERLYELRSGPLYLSGVEVTFKEVPIQSSSERKAIESLSVGGVYETSDLFVRRVR